MDPGLNAAPNFFWSKVPFERRLELLRVKHEVNSVGIGCRGGGGARRVGLGTARGGALELEVRVVLAHVRNTPVARKCK